jgi:hypothetical protein
MITSHEKVKNTIIRLNTKSLLPIIIVLTLLVSSAVVDARTVICESNDRQAGYCPADTRGGIRLSRQLSKAGCYEGKTWGYDRHGIWVSRGCRARFEIGDFRPEYYDRQRSDHRSWRRDDDQRRHRPTAITCQSWENRLTYCRAPLRHARVTIKHRLSGTPCRYDENWGWDRGGIWVKGGCRAVFSIEYYDRQGPHMYREY